MSRQGGAGKVVVFGKDPEPGRVKTRMCPPLSAEQAAELYAAMLEDVLAATGEFALRLGLEPILALDPPEACAAWRGRVPPGYRVIAQRGASLGERMSRVVDDEGGGPLPILLRGSDSPALPEARLASALRALERCDVTLAPDADGGYSLIGLRGRWPGLFSHPMSTDAVLAETVRRAEALGARTELLEAGFDLDRIEDLQALEASLSGSGRLICPRTLEYLDREGPWRRPDGGGN